MFRVIVLGGLALVAHEACGGTTTDGDAGTDANGPDTFPSELPVFVEAAVIDAGNEAEADAFPSELPSQIDGGSQD